MITDDLKTNLPVTYSKDNWNH